MGNSSKKGKRTNATGVGSEQTGGAENQDAPAIVVTKAEAAPPENSTASRKKKGVQFSVEPSAPPDPKSAQLDALDNEKAKELFLEAFKKNPADKLPTDLMRALKKVGVKSKPARAIWTEMKESVADAGEEDDSAEFGSEEDVGDAETELDPNSEQYLLKHPSQFPLEYLEGQYEIKNELGHGAFGVVSLAVTTATHANLPPNTKVAIKKNVGHL